MIQLTIIIPVYNDRDGLRQLLNSIKEQQNIDRDDYEIIIIDDGSNCTYNNIIELYEFNITYVRQKNGRQGKARNNGLSLAKGEYVWFVDADDKIKPNSICLIIEQLNNNESDILVFNAIINNNILKGKVDGQCLLSSLSKNSIVVAPWNKVYSQKFLDENKILFPEYVKFEDLYFSICTIALTKKIKYINEVIYEYFQNIGSTTNTFDVNILDIFTVIEMIETEDRLQHIDFDIINNIKYIHGIKYTLIRVLKSKNILLLYTVIRNSKFKKCLYSIKFKEKSFLLKLFTILVAVISGDKLIG